MISLASCFDPVHRAEVDSLGPEDPGVAPGPLHRPGQPCLVCHGGKGPADRELSIAGTFYLYRDDTLPAEGTQVLVREVATPSVRRTLTSNAAGNFYVEKSEFDPVFPVAVAIIDQRIPAFPPGRDMITPIGQNGGCGYCHVLASDDPQRRMPRLHVNATAEGP